MSGAGRGGAEGVELHLNLLPDADPPGDGSLEELVRRAVRLALEAGTAPPGELSVTCLDEPAMAELNRRWLDREGPTDVIAFDLGADDRLTGDVYLCPAVARRQAEEAGVSFHEEMARLAVHGTLHVLGHEHPEGEERWSSPMFELQERVLARALDRA